MKYQAKLQVYTEHGIIRIPLYEVFSQGTCGIIFLRNKELRLSKLVTTSQGCRHPQHLKRIPPSSVCALSNEAGTCAQAEASATFRKRFQLERPPKEMDFKCVLRVWN